MVENSKFVNTKLEKLPIDWKIEKFEDVTYLITCGLASTPKYVDPNVGIPFLSAQNVQNGKLVLNKYRYISKEFHNQLTKKNKPMRGDILYSRVGANYGEAAIIDIDWEFSIYVSLTLIKIKKDQDVNYFKYLLNSRLCKKQAIVGVVQGGGVQNLNVEIVRKFDMVVPPLAEQRRIADILGTWDKAIDLTTRLISAKQRRKKALMQQLLMGKWRFPGFEEEWREVDLGDLVSVRRGASPRPIHDPKWFSEKGRAWVRIADVTQSPTRFLNEATQYLSPLGESKSVKVEVGDLIMSICATIGVPKIVNIPACIHDGFVVFGDYEEQLDKEFLYHYLNFITGSLANRGQPGTQKNLNTSIVRKIKVPYLSLPEQGRIASVLTACDEEITLLERKLVALRRQKQGLMQQLLTGRVRVGRRTNLSLSYELK